jgi:hypothetical protein|tara:strand:- start:327 stop:482 length:156 start_codon:yes stop_codon:yes gene_type:complete
MFCCAAAKGSFAPGKTRKGLWAVISVFPLWRYLRKMDTENLLSTLMFKVKK